MDITIGFPTAATRKFLVGGATIIRHYESKPHKLNQPYNLSKCRFIDIATIMDATGNMIGNFVGELNTPITANDINNFINNAN